MIFKFIPSTIYLLGRWGVALMDTSVFVLPFPKHLDLVLKKSGFGWSTLFWEYSLAKKKLEMRPQSHRCHNSVFQGHLVNKWATPPTSFDNMPLIDVPGWKQAGVSHTRVKKASFFSFLRKKAEKLLKKIYWLPRNRQFWMNTFLLRHILLQIHTASSSSQHLWAAPTGQLEVQCLA